MCGCLFRTGGSCGTGGSVMDITYPLLIPEDIAQLQAAEKAARDKIRADRIRMLRFLKEGRASARRRRCWAIMCEPFNSGGNAIGGWVALLAPPQRRGAKERITPEAWESLQAEMRAGHIGGGGQSISATNCAPPTA